MLRFIFWNHNFAEGSFKILNTLIIVGNKFTARKLKHGGDSDTDADNFVQLFLPNPSIPQKLRRSLLIPGGI